MGTVRVRYIVDDVETAIDFYRDRLGFEVRFHPAPGFASMERGDLELLLNAPGAGGAGVAGDGVPEPGGWNRFQIVVEDLKGFVEQLSDAGVKFRGKIAHGRGGDQILLEDPSGNVIELFEPPQGSADPDSS